MLLINVTEFFRDPPAWEHLRDEVLPSLLAAKEPDEPIRVWSAGCASGQEAYTAAMVFAELLGVDAFRERVKIYATDIDEDALSQARLATYNAQVRPSRSRRSCASATSSAPTSGSRSARTCAARSSSARNNLVAGRADLAPGPADLPQHADVLQRRDPGPDPAALPLRAGDGGVLMLGKSEMMISHRDLFAADDLKQRIFVKQPRASAGLTRGAFTGDSAERPAAPTTTALSRDAALELGPHAARDRLAHRPADVRQPAARALFQISRDDLGRPFAELALAYRPVELLGPSSRRCASAGAYGRRGRRSRPSAATRGGWTSRRRRC